MSNGDNDPDNQFSLLTNAVLCGNLECVSGQAAFHARLQVQHLAGGRHFTLNVLRHVPSPGETNLPLPGRKRIAISVKISSAGASNAKRMAAHPHNLLKKGDLISQAGKTRSAMTEKTNPNEPIEVNISHINEISHDSTKRTQRC